MLPLIVSNLLILGLVAFWAIYFQKANQET
jgi:hypothetical protein